MGSRLGEPVWQQSPVRRGWGPSRQPVSTGRGLLGSGWPEPGPTRAPPAGPVSLLLRAPGCRDVGCDSPGQDGGPFASAPNRARSPFSVFPRSSPRVLPIPPALTSLPGPHPPLSCSLASLPSAVCLSSTGPHFVPTAGPSPILPAVTPELCLYLLTVLPEVPPPGPRPGLTPHLGLSHSALPILHPAAHSPRHRVTLGSRIGHVTPH